MSSIYIILIIYVGLAVTGLITPSETTKEYISFHNDKCKRMTQGIETNIQDTNKPISWVSPR